jgi:hypothetical protein
MHCKGTTLCIRNSAETHTHSFKYDMTIYTLEIELRVKGDSIRGWPCWDEAGGWLLRGLWSGQSCGTSTSTRPHCSCTARICFRCSTGWSRGTRTTTTARMPACRPSSCASSAHLQLGHRQRWRFPWTRPPGCMRPSGSRSRPADLMCPPLRHRLLAHTREIAQTLQLDPNVNWLRSWSVL